MLLIQESNLSDNDKRLDSLKNSGGNYSISIINPAYEINDKEFEIDDLSKKRDIFSNDINRMKKYKNNLRATLNDFRCNRNKVDRGLEDKINILLHKYDIKLAK